MHACVREYECSIYVCVYVSMHACVCLCPREAVCVLLVTPTFRRHFINIGGESISAEYANTALRSGEKSLS